MLPAPGVPADLPGQGVHLENLDPPPGSGTFVPSAEQVLGERLPEGGAPHFDQPHVQPAPAVVGEGVRPLRRRLEKR